MAASESSAVNNSEYLNQLLKEQQSLSPQCTKAYKLLQQEIERIRADRPADETSQRKDSHVEVHTGKQFRLKVKVHIPVDEHPNFNFVGKLLGPKGSSLQQLQEATQTKMAILGRGSMRDKRKEEELRSQGDPKYSHLHEDLHVEITAFAPPAEAYRRMSSAIGEIQRFLVPENEHPYRSEQDYFDDPRQFQPMGHMNDGKPKPPFGGDGPPHMAPRGGGGPPPARSMPPPMMPPRDSRRPALTQSTYAAPENEEWSARSAPRRGAYHGAAAPRAAPRSYNDGADDYNNYGDNYGDYNSGNNAYYDYAGEADTNYASDDYVDEQRVPPRNAGAAGGAGRNSTRLRAHPYAAAPRRGGY